jgi:hypothetical protein
MCTVLLVRTLVIMGSVEGGVTGGCVLRSRAEDKEEGAIVYISYLYLWLELGGLRGWCSLESCLFCTVCSNQD